MLHYNFMVIALIVSVLLGIALPLIGSGVVYKRLSSSGDALAHSSLAGVAIGLVSGLNPLLISIACCVVSFLIIELLRKKFQKFSEIGVVVVLSCAIGIAGILSNYVKNANFSSYLFGSLALVNNMEFIITIVITVLVIAFAIFLYGPFFSCLYSENEAKVRGTKVGLINFIHSLLLSVTVAVGAKVVGSLVVSSMIVLPTAIAMQFKKGYFWTMIISIITGVIAMVGGFIISYEVSWPAGATIVLLTVAILIVVFLVKGILLLVHKKSKSA